MKLLVIILAVFVLYLQWSDASILPRAQSYCYSTDSVRPQVKRFTSKTAYQVTKGATFASDVAVPNCKPVKFWLLSRHGTRLPEVDQIEVLPNLLDMQQDILENYKKTVENGLCPQDLQLIKDWVLDTNITVDKEQYLTVQGWNDLKLMAQDFKKGLPNLLSEFQPADFLFRHTETQRTEGSFQAFVEGLFGPGAHNMIQTSKSIGQDTFLAPFNYCQDWLDRENGKKDEGTEGGLFKKSPEMIATLERISARLGFTKPLKYKKIKQLWDICRFEFAWFVDQPSAWCTAFTMEDVKVFEYLDDLGKEYASGHVSDVNPNIPCEIVQDLLKRLESDSGPKVVAYFSHSALIQLFATSLGIQKSNTFLKSTSYATEANRPWRTSELDPFAANYAVVKYDCSADPVDPSPKIRFFSNQRPIDFPGCRNGLCKLSDFLATYQKYKYAVCANIFCSAQKL